MGGVTSNVTQCAGWSRHVARVGLVVGDGMEGRAVATAPPRQDHRLCDKSVVGARCAGHCGGGKSRAYLVSAQPHRYPACSLTAISGQSRSPWRAARSGLKSVPTSITSPSGLSGTVFSD